MGSVIANPAPTVGLGYIMHHSGQEGHGLRWQQNYVEALIAGQGFPPPLPLFSGKDLTTRVKPASKWPRLAVDQWFLDRLPPEAAQAEDAGRRMVAANDMDEAAGAIAQRIGRRQLLRVGQPA